MKLRYEFSVMEMDGEHLAVAVGANVSPTGTSVDSGIVIGTALDAASGSGELINVAHRAPITLS